MAIDEYLRLTDWKPGQFLFAGRGDGTRGLTTRQYARLVREWVASIGLDPAKFGTHSLRLTKAVLIYRRTGNLRAVQLLLETPTNCPCTPGRRNDPVSVSSALRRDGRHTATAGALRRRHGRRAAARYVDRTAAGVDAERISSARDIAIHTTFSP